MCKMGQITKQEYKKCEVEIINMGKYLWVNRKDLEVESDVVNQVQIFDKCDLQKQKYRQKSTPNAKYQRFRVFLQNDLIERKIKWFSKSSKKILEFKKKLRLDPDVITCDEHVIISTLQVAFEGEIVLTQHCIKKKRLDAYFPKYKLGIEIDEYNHEGRNFEYKQSRQFIIASHGITIIRTNPDAADFDMNRLINQIYTHIIESTKVSTKKSLIDDLSKGLLELEFKSHHSIKPKCCLQVKQVKAFKTKTEKQQKTIQRLTD